MEVSDNIPASSAYVPQPAGLWMDSRGKFFFCETGKNRVRVISVTGLVFTIAGSGVMSSDIGEGGLALNVALDSSYGIYGDPTNNVLYFSGTYFIWKYDLFSGMISRFAGSQAGLDFNGDGLQAIETMFSVPRGLFLSSLGILSGNASPSLHLCGFLLVPGFNLQWR